MEQGKEYLQACTFHCISNYETPEFHALNKCNIHDEGCVVLKAPEEHDQCSVDKTNKYLRFSNSVIA